ncbi:response regulator receiver-like protein [Marinobacter sp. TBZ242]|uniref:Response regulator receiver-like protein n=1 Tax=Marinobacter azerbaijanicus TaxID=3050455 RepID=A0ABT7ICJ2_9GAMM|nr:response regulator receiver-like protein [Marinobacter sp. TBZ242]MDL0431875.1 response regulator receiver-like protein [Marinobacter sp. TBZ242]
MNRDDILVCVADDIGIRTWLERALDGMWPVEFVASSDLSRVSRLVEATGSRFVMVAADENDAEKALRIISALTKSREDLAVVSLARRVNQDFLLRSMRAGARDCFIVSSDGEELRSRIQQFLQATPVEVAADSRPANARNKITLVTSSSPVVDTRFFAQNLAFTTNKLFPEARILALDTSSTDRHAFYLDSNNRVTLESLLQNPESLDQAMIETALEEYAPNLRLLAGNLSPEALGDDRNADLFIAVSQLMSMFDYIVVNVDPVVADFWVSAVGLHAKDLVMVIQPIVEQAHEARRQLDGWRDHLARDCRKSLVLDCYEKKGSPALGELERAVGVDYMGNLPLDWTSRLMSINAGIPLHKLPQRSQYQKQLEAIMRRYATGENREGQSLTKRKLLRAG